MHRESETNGSEKPIEETPRREKISGILRPESGPRSSRIGLNASLLSPLQGEPTSPQPSVDRLSVTFALAEESSDSNLKSSDCGSKDLAKLKNIASEMHQTSAGDVEEEGDEEDYSASACAIMQRRVSTKRQSRRKRRSSSPFGPDVDNASRRRSSAFTTSSGDTSISMEEGGTQEQVFEKLKLHKEILSGVKQQAWPLRRKMRLVRQAKSYVRRHEGALQERLAQNKNTKDAIARASLFFTKKWQYFRREMVNLQSWFVPWEHRIKEIESHFGSAVASYFTFLRWLFWVNFVVAGILTAFVAIPEMLTANPALAGERKIMLADEVAKSKHFMTLWEFEGILKYSAFFYGWYTDQDSKTGYRLPLAYFVTNLVVYMYSFAVILRKMAENSRMSKLTEKEDECVFSWKLFTGWDFMIGNPETAHNRVASLVLSFKEALLEEAEKQKDERNWKIISMRIIVNICVIGLLALSAYAVVKVVARSASDEIEQNWWRQNEITIVMSLISFLFPIFFEILGMCESYHPRKQLRLQLARIMVLNLLNLYSLIIALFNKIDYMEDELKSLRPENTSCVQIPVPCSEEILNLPYVVNSTSSRSAAALVSMSLIALSSNVTSAQSGLARATLPLTDIKNENLIYDPMTYNKTLYADYNVSAEEYPPLDYVDYNTFNSKDDNNATINTSTFSVVENVTFEYNDTYTRKIEFFLDTTIDSEYYPDNSTEFRTANVTDYATDKWSDSTSSVTNEDSTHLEERSYVTNNYDYSLETSNSSVDDIFNSTSESYSTEIDVSSTTESGKRVVPIAKDNYLIVCYEQRCTTASPETSLPPGIILKQLDLKTRKKLRRLCWETMFGQELAKLTVMDLVLTVFVTLGIDFFRAFFVRYMNSCWCWDLEKQFPQYGDFKIAENILHLVNNQGMVWMGMFFSPGLTALNLLKLGILMYLRSWAVLTCNVPHEVVFRASRSNNFYYALLLTMLFLCVLPVGYAIVWVAPSWHCGPFSGYHRIYNLVTESFRGPKIIENIIDYITSPAVVIPLIVLMTLIIYYMASLTGLLREANNDLKIQLRHERTEERRKLFKIVERRHRASDTPFARWKKILPVLPANKDLPQDHKNGNGHVDNSNHVKANGKMLPSESAELTDVEQDSLPQDSPLPRQPDDPPASRVRSNGGPLRISGDSWESQSIDCAIPEIRISEEEAKARGSQSSRENIVVVVNGKKE